MNAGRPHSDPVTGVLYNKLGLGTAAELEAAEREITHAPLILLDESPVSASYDRPHPREIHKRIFGDIYGWAGRDECVYRINPPGPLCPAPFSCPVAGRPGGRARVSPAGRLLRGPDGCYGEVCRSQG